MLYLLDANVLITADRDYYPLDRIPHFWEWLLEQADAGLVKMPYEIVEEVLDGRSDDLVKWLKNHRNVLQLNEEVDIEIFRDVTEVGYAPDLNDAELITINKDTFLIAYARMKPERCVVTLEVSSPAKKRANKKIPDVCNGFNVAWCNTFQLIRALDFKIK